MTQKQLQHDSKYNEFDTDGDGIVTDEELVRSERMLQIENNDKMQDQQRLMAWVAMLSSIFDRSSPSNTSCGHRPHEHC
jgi:Ca2+-binding EF-hand superfamily protein